MTFGAMIGWLTVYEGGSLWLGMLPAIAGGAAFGLLHRVLVVSLGLSQHVTGLGITLFASSFTYYVYRPVIPVSGSPPTIVPFQPRAIPGLSSLPFLGEALFSQAAPTYLAVGLALLLAYALAHTPLWTRHPSRRRESTRRGGAEYQSDRPAACRRRGWQRIDECRGLIPYYNCFQQLLSHYGSGTRLGLHRACCLCIVRPGRALGGALLFAFCDAFQLRLQHVIGKEVPYQLLLMMPYLVSILALLLVARRARVPQALMVPYRRGER
jgi:ABC-type uncharacterized transport system permease subunit